MSNGKTIRSGEGFVTAAPSGDQVRVSVGSKLGEPRQAQSVSLASTDARALAAELVAIADDLDGKTSA